MPRHGLEFDETYGTSNHVMLVYDGNVFVDATSYISSAGVNADSGNGVSGLRVGSSTERRVVATPVHESGNCIITVCIGLPMGGNTNMAIHRVCIEDVME